MSRVATGCGPAPCTENTNPRIQSLSKFFFGPLPCCVAAGLRHSRTVVSHMAAVDPDAHYALIKLLAALGGPATLLTQVGALLTFFGSSMTPSNFFLLMSGFLNTYCCWFFPRIAWRTITFFGSVGLVLNVILLVYQLTTRFLPPEPTNTDLGGVILFWINLSSWILALGTFFHRIFEHGLPLWIPLLRNNKEAQAASKRYPLHSIILHRLAVANSDVVPTGHLDILLKKHEAAAGGVSPDAFEHDAQALLAHLKRISAEADLEAQTPAGRQHGD